MNMAKWSGIFAFFGLLACGVGCGDDTTGSGGDGTTASATTTTTTGSTSTGQGGTGVGGGEPAPLFAAMVRGTLFTDDMTAAQSQHDMTAAGGEAQAKAAGDLAHDVHLGTDILGTTPNQFLGLDRWNDATNMGAFYSDPAIQQAFGSLFAGPPTLETFSHQPTWHSWGDLDTSDGVTPHYWAVIRGRLASADLAAMKAIHDQIASGGQATAEALGDRGHVVFLGLEDPREFLAFDLWDNPNGPVTLYTNPDFGAAFSQLFEGQPTIGIYASTDWYQW